MPFVLLRMCVLPIDSNLQGPDFSADLCWTVLPKPFYPLSAYGTSHTCVRAESSSCLFQSSHAPVRSIIVPCRANMTFSVSWKIVRAFADRHAAEATSAVVFREQCSSPEKVHVHSPFHHGMDEGVAAICLVHSCTAFHILFGVRRPFPDPILAVTNHQDQPQNPMPLSQPEAFPMSTSQSPHSTPAHCRPQTTPPPHPPVVGLR